MLLRIRHFDYSFRPHSYVSSHCCPKKMWLYSWFGTDFLLKGNLRKPHFARSSARSSEQKIFFHKKKKTLRQDENCVRNKNYRNIRSVLRIPSVRGYGGCAFDGGVCRRHPVVRHGDGVVLRFSSESVFVYPITKKLARIAAKPR